MDFKTGTDFGLSLFYLIPVAFSGWFAGRGWAVVLGIAAGTVWFIANVAAPDGDVSLLVILWNTFTRYVIYISLGVLLALLRRDGDALRRLARIEGELARRDVLTGLLNARGALERVEEELERAREAQRSMCLAYIDLDNFKPFNDKFGHAAGDDVLVEVAKILRDSVGEESITARLGGDEFVVLLRGKDLAQAEAVGRRIAAQVYSVGAIWNIGFGATVGIVRFTDLPKNATELLHLADDAMYAGKLEAKGSVTVREF
jgi:diguanylate cyclase (GGDEF)-like protein